MTSCADSPHYWTLLEGFCFIGSLASFTLKLKYSSPESSFEPQPFSCNTELAVDIAAEKPAAEESRTGDITDNCSLMSIKDKHDVFFNVAAETKDLIPASKEILVKASEMFLAMLQGNYCESKLRHIDLMDTTYYAVNYVVHYLHGCNLDCGVISDLVTCDVTTETVENCLDVFALCNRFLVIPLQKFLKVVISSRFLLPIHAEHIYNFAKLHEMKDLSNDCVKAVFVDCRNRNEQMKGLITFLKGPIVDTFLQNFKSLFSEYHC